MTFKAICKVGYAELCPILINVIQFQQANVTGSVKYLLIH